MTEGPEEQKFLRVFRPPRDPEPPLYVDLTESYKVILDVIKQLTTLNAGSIVVIGTFLSDIFPTEQGTLAVGPFLKGLIAASFVCFGVSLLLSTFLMSYFSRVINEMTYKAKWQAQQQ